MIDIGELFADPDKIRQQCADRAWAKSYIIDHIDKPELREYFIKEIQSLEEEIYALASSDDTEGSSDN